MRTSVSRDLYIIARVAKDDVIPGLSWSYLVRAFSDQYEPTVMLGAITAATRFNTLEEAKHALVSLTLTHPEYLGELSIQRVLR